MSRSRGRHRSNPIWNATDDELRDSSAVELAIKYGSQPAAICRARAERGIRVSKLVRHKKAPAVKIERLCLRCDQPFVGRGRYNRICPRCRTHWAKYRNGFDMLTSQALYALTVD